jgi:hypothetical protein
MRRSAQISPSGRFWKLIFPAIALLCTLPLVAQKAQEASPPKYNIHTETKMKDTVEEMKRKRQRKHMVDGLSPQPA